MDRFNRPQLARRARPFLRGHGGVGPIRMRGGFRPVCGNGGFGGRFAGGIGQGRNINSDSLSGDFNSGGSLPLDHSRNHHSQNNSTLGPTLAQPSPPSLLLFSLFT